MTKRLTNLYLPEKKGALPLKRSMSGYEIEAFILDNAGMVDNSDTLLTKGAKKTTLPLQKECAKAMIEMICMPHKRLSLTSLNFVDNLIELHSLAEEHERVLYPFGTYPGRFDPEFREDKWYAVKKKILGTARFRKAGMSCGFHQHYALPRGVYDAKTKNIKYNANSKIKRTLLDSYNMLNAIDPAITCMLQSSPFVDGVQLAKDSRIVIYRGGEKLRYKEGVYGKYQFFGALSPYKQTLHDLLSTVKRRHDKWVSLLEKAGADAREAKKMENQLKYCWNPVKVNPIGTLEYRGGDANYLTTILGASTLLKFVLRDIQQNFRLVIPMDMELKDAFKTENNLIFIPPHSLVRKHLQPESAYNGLASKDVYTYVKAFYKFAKGVINTAYKPLLKPIATMIDEKKTLSDQMIARAKKDGFKEEITQEYAQEFALYFASSYRKDLEIAHNLLTKCNDAL